MKYESSQINKDVILVTTQRPDDLLENEVVGIKHPYQQLIDEMKTMVDNPNRTIFDLQDRFFNKSFSQKEHNICLFWDYDDAFVTKALFPNRITYQDYQEQINEEIRRLREEHKIKKFQEFPDYLNKEIDEYILSIKRDFCRKCERYIAAEDYNNTVREISKQRELKIFSTEKIGWTDFIHTVGKDIKFIISTNFGYGRSAYFRVHMQYKGIDILPYADIVNYAYANMKDLVRATRCYYAKRCNWSLAMDFMKDTANLASQNEERFLKKWLRDEVKEMLAGLKSLCREPDRTINNYENYVGVETPYLAVRNFTKQEIVKYRARKEEMNTALKATKISGALMFLDNLKSIAKIFGYVDEAIQELKKVALSIIPEMTLLENLLKQEIAQLKFQLKEKEDELKGITALMEPFKLKLDLLKTGIMDKAMAQEIELNFKKLNPEYVNLLAKHSSLDRDILKMKCHLTGRANFLGTLLSQHDIILAKTNEI